jgi:hypothetical protein
MSDPTDSNTDEIRTALEREEMIARIEELDLEIRRRLIAILAHPDCPESLLSDDIIKELVS